jgi:hypothetical protein
VGLIAPAISPALPGSLFRALPAPLISVSFLIASDVLSGDYPFSCRATRAARP